LEPSYSIVLENPFHKSSRRTRLGCWVKEKRRDYDDQKIEKNLKVVKGKISKNISILKIPYFANSCSKSAPIAKICPPMISGRTPHTSNNRKSGDSGDGKQGQEQITSPGNCRASGYSRWPSIKTKIGIWKTTSVNRSGQVLSLPSYLVIFHTEPSSFPPM
jgi:hypothetical protein